MERKSLTDFSSELQKTIEVVKKVGDEILVLYNTDFDVTIKDDNSPVTQADLLAEKILIEELVQKGDGLISEETPVGNLPLEQERIWIIDPLDGTRDFVNKTGEFSIMVALHEGGEKKFSVVFAPALGKLWFAEKGMGSYIEKEGKISKIQVSDRIEPQEQRMLISRNNFKPEEEKMSKEFGIISENQVKMGSIGVKICSIAEGVCEFYLNISTGLGQWDGCAPALILEEAGGIIFDKSGNDLKFNGPLWNLDNGLIGLNSSKFKQSILDIINND